MRPFLVFGIKRAIEIARCTVELLLPGRCMLMLAELRRLTPPTGNGNHAISSFFRVTLQHDPYVSLHRATTEMSSGSEFSIFPSGVMI